MSVVTAVRWLFADQLGPHFLDDPEQPLLLVESRAVLRRRSFHRAKAHLVLSALRHRAAELAERVTFVQADTYAEALAGIPGPIEVVHPTSRAALRLVTSLGDRVRLLPARGFVTAPDEFAAWVRSRGSRRLLMEDFYRDTRRRTGVLMDGPDPVGGRWNLDADNRQPPPAGARTLGVPPPAWPVEDDIDGRVRADLDAWTRDGSLRTVGRDGPRRFAATRGEARSALDAFVRDRLPAFGPYEDAMLTGDPWMAHSLLSAPLNLGRLDPMEAVEAATGAYEAGLAPLASVEGLVRQVLGWRDYVWHLYWHLGDDYRTRNALGAHRPLPRWFAELDADAVTAACLRTALEHVRDHGWAHHIERLMVLGNWALQRGYDPQEMTDWFHRSFVDGYDWVMLANVVGMALHADAGVMATKPYAAGGAYLKRMSDSCRGCAHRPDRRTGDRACPFTAGYWAFLDRNAAALRGNHRMAQPLAGLTRLADRADVVAQESARGDDPP